MYERSWDGWTPDTDAPVVTVEDGGPAGPSDPISTGSPQTPGGPDEVTTPDE